MDYYLNRINVILIALVGGLCVYQWSGEKRSDQLIEDLRRSVRTAESHIAAQDQAIRGANEDIDEFKKIIAAAKTKSDASDVDIRQQRARIFTLEQDAKRRAAEADLAAKSLAAYKQGLAERDGNIQLLLAQRQKLVDANQDVAKKATTAIHAYDELYAKYATLVDQYNDLGKRYKALTAPPAAAKPSA